MLKTLLIHSDNAPLNSDNRIVESILFSPTIKELSNSDIDTYISKKILPQIANTQCEIIYIRDTLSDNYIDFYGLVLAYHIRLSIKELNEKSLLPIVILSDINSFTINKITPLGRILFTKNIFLAANNDTALIKFNDRKLTPLSIEEYKNDFLNKITIDPPKDYLSHHSITNEWAIYQWSHLLGVDTEATRTNEAKINTMLYFKYLVNKYNLEEKSKKLNKESNKSGNMLFIDDKGIDGWNDVIRKFIESNYKSVNFFTLEEESTEQVFKDKNVTDLEPLIENKIKNTDPDVILLDLRLLEHIDNNQEKVLDISGIKILKYIKKQNPSIQVIIFSASTDSLILDELYANGILGYIKKDSPTNKYLTSKNSLTKLDKLIKKGLDRKYLKTIWKLQQDTLQLPFLTNNKDPIIFELRKNITSIFDILNSNMPNLFVYAMLAIMKNIELLNDYYIEEAWLQNKKYSFWKESNKRIQTLDYGVLRDTKDGDYNLSTENKIMAIIKEKTSIEEGNIANLIKQLICSRNFAIHPQEKESCTQYLIKTPEAKHIVMWFEMIYEIIRKTK